MQKRDMQKVILSILVESKKNDIPYLTKSQIVDKVKKIKPDVENLESKISQALYLLKVKNKKWDRPHVIKYEKDKERGWTIEEIIY